MEPRLVPPASPAQAYWRQRAAVREATSRLVALQEAVDHLSNLSPPQWAQLLAFALEFRPTLILELGRQLGNSTCVFTEAANRLPVGSCRVLSLCRSDDWEARTAPRLRGIVPPEWFSPLRAELADILTWDYRSLIRADDRVLVFWDAHGFEIAECVLGEILPLLADRPHVVAMHDLSDARYLAPEILNRPKQGFSSALPYVLRDEYRQMSDHFLGNSQLVRAGILDPGPIKTLIAEHAAHRADHGNRLWLLINSEVWYRLMILGEPREQLRLTS